MNKLMVRLQNKKVLVSLFAGVAMILTNTGIVSIDVVEQYNVMFNTILSMLVAVGIVSDPDSHVK